MRRVSRYLGAAALGIGAVAAYRYVTWRPRQLGYLYGGRRLLLGHRGAPAEAPANTALAFRRAMEAGADGVELDVHLTRDERVVVVHDDTVVGAGGVPIAVRQMSLAQIREIDAGGGEPIPTLDEALDAAGAQAIVNIELKGTSVTSEGLERAVVRVVHERRMSERVILSSFNPFRLWRVGCLGPQLPRAMLHGPGTPIFLRDLWLLPLVQPDALHPDHSLVDEAYMKRAQMWGVRVNVWTVDDPAEARRLLELGVDALITNDPRRLRGVV